MPTPRHRRTVLLLLLLTALSATASNAADGGWPDCRVLLVDGTVHEHVAVAWKLEGFLIGLTTADRTEINIYPRDVATIHAADGRDITQEVADASPAAMAHDMFGSRRMEPLEPGLAVDLGGSFGASSGYGGMHAAGNGFVGVRRPLAPRFHLRAQYTLQRVREDLPDGFGLGAVWTDEVAVLVGYRAIHPRRR